MQNVYQRISLKYTPSLHLDGYCDLGVHLRPMTPMQLRQWATEHKLADAWVIAVEGEPTPHEKPVTLSACIEIFVHSDKRVMIVHESNASSENPEWIEMEDPFWDAVPQKRQKAIPVIPSNIEEIWLKARKILPNRNSIPDPATPKQIAYLSYMGVNSAHRLTKEQASNKIDEIYDIHFEDSHEKRKNWVFDRFILHPDIYADEYTAFLEKQLPDALHSYVHGKVKKSSERLTRSKLCKVVRSMLAEDSQWWRNPKRSAIFYERFQLAYPACCDGEKVLPREKTETSRWTNEVHFQSIQPTQPLAMAPSIPVPLTKKAVRENARKEEAQASMFGCCLMLLLLLAACAWAFFH
jgi:hypothetical protein